MARPASFVKMLFWVGLASALLYFAGFTWIEHNRYKKGPWEFVFRATNQTPVLEIIQPALGLSNVTLIFLQAPLPSHLPQTVRFQLGQPPPFDLPFGRCVFLDTLFLPGTVVVEAFGHEIQVLPRTLTIDRREQPWKSGEKILLTNRLGATLSSE
ncbi:MAG TPA: hypothetical protein PKO21_07460 [Verrucomicrobiota bacterium]|nr:hypothetical protein [Verrucomicrobiota bacterium]